MFLLSLGLDPYWSSSFSLFLQGKRNRPSKNIIKTLIVIGNCRHKYKQHAYRTRSDSQLTLTSSRPDSTSTLASDARSTLVADMCSAHGSHYAVPAEVTSYGTTSRRPAILEPMAFENDLYCEYLQPSNGNTYEAVKF